MGVAYLREWAAAEVRFNETFCSHIVPGFKNTTFVSESKTVLIFGLFSSIYIAHSYFIASQTSHLVVILITH